MAPAGWKPSKYKAIEPTLIEDLVKYYPGEGVLRALLSFDWLTAYTARRLCSCC